MSGAKFMSIAIGLVLVTSLVFGTWEAGYKLGMMNGLRGRTSKNEYLLTVEPNMEIECHAKGNPKLGIQFKAPPDIR